MTLTFCCHYRFRSAVMGRFRRLSQRRRGQNMDFSLRGEGRGSQRNNRWRLSFYSYQPAPTNRGSDKRLASSFATAPRMNGSDVIGGSSRSPNLSPAVASRGRLRRGERERRVHSARELRSQPKGRLTFLSTFPIPCTYYYSKGKS